MIRSTVLPALLLIGSPLPARAPVGPLVSPGLAVAIGDRGEPDEDQLRAFTKMFLVQMRNHHGDTNANALRSFFDPRYLKKHDLTDRDLAAEIAPVGRIYGYEFADDRQTILCLVDTTANPRAPAQEAILLRFSVHEGKVYLSPAKAPDPKTGAFTPWILRTKLDVLRSK